MIKLKETFLLIIAILSNLTKTQALLIGLVLVSFAEIIYSPWHTDLWEYMFEDYSLFMQTIVKEFFNLFMPVFVQMLDLCGYLFSAMNDFDTVLSSSKYTLEQAVYNGLTIMLYFLLVHALEKHHQELEYTENKFTVFIHMLCLENITIYLLNLVCYLIGKLISNITISQTEFIILYILFFIINFLPTSFYIIYCGKGIFISLIIPLSILALLSFVTNGIVVATIFGYQIWLEDMIFLLIMIIGKIIWYKCSSRTYVKLLNSRMFTAYKTALEKIDTILHF